MKDIYFHLPRIQGNTLYLSWEPQELFLKNEYWIKYNELENIQASDDLLIQAYLPIFIIFAALSPIRLHLPKPINVQIIKKWKHLIQVTANHLYKHPFEIEFMNSTDQSQNVIKAGTQTGLLFGGGTESLVTLARLRQQGISPILISYGGEAWTGSDPDVNPDKFKMDGFISKELNLQLLTIYSNVKTLFEIKKWHFLLRKKINIVNATMFLPFNVASLIPVAQQLNLKQIVSGNEKESDIDDEYFSLSSTMADLLKQISPNLSYRSHLNDLRKVQVMNALYTQHQDVARYQYSCYKNHGERWCLNCEKCLRNYVAMKTFGFDPALAGIKNQEIFPQIKNMIWEVKWAIVKNPTLFVEWSNIRKEALKVQAKDALEILNKIFKNMFLKKILFKMFGYPDSYYWLKKFIKGMS